jgi:hypothetical protein
MSAEPQLSPEWESARADWYKQAEGELVRLNKALAEAQPGTMERHFIYAPMHDVAGLAGVLGYPLLGKIARGLTENLRRGPDPLDEKMLALAKAYLTTLSALHAKDVRGEGGDAGEAILAKLAAIKP